MVQDVLAWSFTKNGRYNVKSRYHVAKQLRLAKTNSGEAWCNHQIFLCGHGYGRLGSQIRSEFFHGEHAIIYCLRKTIW